MRKTLRGAKFALNFWAAETFIICAPADITECIQSFESGFTLPGGVKSGFAWAVKQRSAIVCRIVHRGVLSLLGMGGRFCS